MKEKPACCPVNCVSRYAASCAVVYLALNSDNRGAMIVFEQSIPKRVFKPAVGYQI